MTLSSSVDLPEPETPLRQTEPLQRQTEGKFFNVMLGGVRERQPTGVLPSLTSGIAPRPRRDRLAQSSPRGAGEDSAAGDACAGDAGSSISSTVP